MKIKDLEKLINERLEKEGYTTRAKEDYFSTNADIVGKILNQVLQENNVDVPRITNWQNRNDLECKFCDVEGDFYIKIKRKKGSTHYNLGFGYTTYYYIDSIEFYTSEKDITIEELHDIFVRSSIDKQLEEKAQIRATANFLKEHNITFEEAQELMYKFKKYEYKIKREMEDK